MSKRFVMRCSLFLSRLLITATLFSAACSRQADKSVRADLMERCVIVAPTDTVASGSWRDWISRYMTAARVYPGNDLALASETSLKADQVLVLIGSTSLDESARDIVAAHLSRGGRLLNLGMTHVLEGHRDAALAGVGGPSFISTSGVFQINSSGLEVELKPLVYRGPYQPADGLQGGTSRWFPVINALPATAAHGGWPGFIHLGHRETEQHSVSGWIGFEPVRDHPEKLIPIMESMLEGMTKVVFLRHASAERYSSRNPAPVTVRADWVDRRPRDLSPFRLAVEWINERGVQIRRVVSPPLDPLVMPVELNIGQTPDTTMRSERYTLRFSLRDRNDQVTHDVIEQTIKVFPANDAASAGNNTITVSSGQLTQGRRPVYMLGVHYWPRLAGEIARHGGHWLDHAHFDPVQLDTDLDLMAAVGINSIAIEYTSVEQAPQMLYVLNELRNRSMWACLYIPALYPLDLRMEEAQRMMEAIRLETWPEIYALEVARGLAIKTRPEMRRLDNAWADWIDEHFNSLHEAEQKLGVTFWKERGRLSGPPAALLAKGPHRDPSIALYYTFLHDYASRRMGYIRQWMRNHGYTVLLTARPSYGSPESPTIDAVDHLDVSAGAIHLDFLSPDAWTVHPLKSMYADGELLYAYVRGVGEGKPVVWSAYGQHIGSKPDSDSYQRQMEVYNYYLDLFIRQGSSGAYAWWFPPGNTSVYEEDWGVVHPQGSWRMVEESFRTAKLRLRQGRLQPRPTVRQNAPLNLSARQWRDQQADRSGLFAKAVSADVTEWNLAGTGLDSDILLDPGRSQRWSEVDGFHLLNAEWGSITSSGVLVERPPGDNVRIYTGKTLAMELLNTGTIRWVNSAERRPGSIWLRISQPGHPFEWTSLLPLVRGGKQILRWTPRETGIWEIQPHLIGYGKFGERLLVEVTEPPNLF